MTRCTTCILPEVYPNITFDESGECNYCKAHEPIQYYGADKLKLDMAEVIAQKKDKIGKYDCLVPISGGKDSTFVLYYLTKICNMKVLAFNYDNGVTHPQAQENVRAISKQLGVKLVTKQNKKQKDYLITNLRAYIRKPSIGMVPMFCTGCRYGIIGNAFNIARENKIPMIIIGWSPIEDTPFKEAYLKASGNSVRGGLIRNLMNNISYMKPGNLIAAVKDYYHNYQHVKDWNIVLKLLHPGVTMIQFYDYIPYDPDSIQATLENEVNWKVPDKVDSWQWDCKIKLIQNYFYNQEANFTATDGYLSEMIREGFITREEAIKRLDYIKQNQNSKLDTLHQFLKEINAEELIPYFSESRKNR